LNSNRQPDCCDPSRYEMPVKNSERCAFTPADGASKP
jgi:hypothetical protein